MTKPISPRLRALLTSTIGDNTDLFKADTYEFTLIGGGTLRYTSGDADLTVNGKVYGAGGVEVGPYVGTHQNDAKAHWGLGTNADTLTFDVIPGSATVLGEPFLQACADGVFDGATLKLQRLFMPTYGDTRRGPVTVFSGLVAEVDVGRSKATFIVNSHVELLDHPFPRNLYQAGCVNNLGDTACGVNLASLATAGTVATGSTNGVLLANLSTTPSGQFDQGKLTFTSGLLINTSRTVKVATPGSPGSITLLYAFPSAPAIGDTFSIFPGCNKSFTDANGCPKFSNTARWRGADKIPTAESAI